ncbi:proprotein convertase P-domain-containing protein [Chryseolinea soli]|uniref:Peptidase n=1 Tax=Chryseolinea soli TaxID=2321403 RepID=A0A385SGB6_9BACT|nr:proprotein convertase P-domain-containing protein [Chryseolinea soli]AYB29974.1 peptidase [Chryseolinea soli]
MATKKSKSGSRLYTYQNGKKVFLRKKPDQFVVREAPEDLIGTDKMKALERTSPSSTRVTVSPAALDSEMKKMRKEAVTHHAYTLEDSDAEFLITDRIIVTFKKPATHAKLSEFMAKYALILMKKYSETEFLFQLTEQTGMNPVKLVVAITETETSVATCEHDLNRRVKRSLNLPTDAKYNQQWHLHRRLVSPEFDQRSSSNCEDAWNLLGNFGSADVVIGITDDGCKIDHPDFDSPGKFATWGYMSDLTLVHRDAISANPQKMYQTGSDHGTACCGVVAAEVDASLVVGAAPGCRLLPIKWESDDEGLFISDDKFITVLNFISDKVDVLSNSWGMSPVETWSSNVVNKIKSLALTGGRRGKGIVFAWASGNENCPISFTSNQNVPYTSGVEVRPDGSGVWVGVKTSKTFSHNLVGIPGVIQIAALASNAQRSHYSNYGTGISLCAPTNNVHEYHRLSVPGLGITTTSGEGPLFEDEFGGTSSATPLIAGIAGLVVSANPTLTALEVISVLQRTASKDLSMTGYPKTPPANFDTNTSWDISPVAPFDKGDFKNINHPDGTWSPWFGFGKVDAGRAVAAALQSMPGPVTGNTIVKSSTPGKAIPDNNPAGITDKIAVNEQGTIAAIKVELDITHTYIGDLVVSLTSPQGTVISIHNRNGGSADNLKKIYDVQSLASLASLAGKAIQGDWTLKVADLALVDTGVLNGWKLHFDLSAEQSVLLEDAPGIVIPDNNPTGVERSLQTSTAGTLKEVEVGIDITHTYIGDLIVNLVSPKGSIISLHSKAGGSADNLIKTYTFNNTIALRTLQGEQLSGTWKLKVSDTVGQDVGKLNKWSLKLVKS